MKDVIKKIITRLYPELSQGYHLPLMAVVSAISDAPRSGGVCDVFRPRLAVDVRLLDEHGNIDENQPLIEGVSVAMPAAGQERGFAALPEPGTVVELAFAYGKQSQPFIRSVMPFRMSLPTIDAGAMTWQQNNDSRQTVDAAGNWKRVTNGTITDDSRRQITRCQELLREIVNEISNISGDSTEDIAGVKKIMAGAVKLLASGSAHMGAADNVNITAGQNQNVNAGSDINFKSGQDLNINAVGDINADSENINVNVSQDAALTVGQDKTETVNRDLTQTVGGNLSQTVTGNMTQTIQGNTSTQTQGNTDNVSTGDHSIKGAKVWLGSTSENVLQLIIEFMTATVAALNVLSGHNHPYTGPITESQGQAVAASGAEITAVQARLTIIKK